MSIKGVLKKLTVALFFFLIQIELKAQTQYDSIVYVNGTRQAAKIIEISDKYIKFKNPLDTLGPTFSVPTRHIQRFILKNGCLDMPELGFKNCVKDPLKDVIKDSDFKRTIIGVDIGQAFIQHIQFNVEHIFKNRLFAVYGYINTSLLDGQDSATYAKLQCRIAGGYCKGTYGGFDFKMYPFDHKKMTMYISCGIELGSATQIVVQSVANVVNNNSGYGYGYQTTTYTDQVSFNNKVYHNYHVSIGAMWRVTKRFVIQYYCTFGINQFNTHYFPGQTTVNDFSPKIGGGLILGGAF
ncbi:MAG TPA: hypothetical protein VKG26_00390 [Bacteroidia bacterium]|nr:hypothetical protein [Bacteroidia bacterium]